MSRTGRPVTGRETKVNKPVTMYPSLWKKAVAKAEKLGLSFSRYVSKCIKYCLDNDVIGESDEK